MRDGQDARRSAVRARLAVVEHPEDLLDDLCAEWGIDRATWGANLRRSPMPDAVAVAILRDAFAADVVDASDTSRCVVCRQGMDRMTSCRGGACRCSRRGCRKPDGY